MAEPPDKPLRRKPGCTCTKTDAFDEVLRDFSPHRTICTRSAPDPSPSAGGASGNDSQQSSPRAVRKKFYKCEVLSTGTQGPTVSKSRRQENPSEGSAEWISGKSSGPSSKPSGPSGGQSTGGDPSSGFSPSDRGRSPCRGFSCKGRYQQSQSGDRSSPSSKTGPSGGYSTRDPSGTGATGTTGRSSSPSKPSYRPSEPSGESSASSHGTGTSGGYSTRDPSGTTGRSSSPSKPSYKPSEPSGDRSSSPSRKRSAGTTGELAAYKPLVMHPSKKCDCKALFEQLKKDDQTGLNALTRHSPTDGVRPQKCPRDCRFSKEYAGPTNNGTRVLIRSRPNSNNDLPPSMSAGTDPKEPSKLRSLGPPCEENTELPCRGRRTGMDPCTGEKPCRGRPGDQGYLGENPCRRKLPGSQPQQDYPRRLERGQNTYFADEDDPDSAGLKPGRVVCTGKPPADDTYSSSKNDSRVCRKSKAASSRTEDTRTIQIDDTSRGRPLTRDEKTSARRSEKSPTEDSFHSMETLVPREDQPPAKDPTPAPVKQPLLKKVSSRSVDREPTRGLETYDGRPLRSVSSDRIQTKTSQHRRASPAVSAHQHTPRARERQSKTSSGDSALRNGTKDGSKTPSFVTAQGSALDVSPKRQKRSAGVSSAQKDDTGISCEGKPNEICMAEQSCAGSAPPEGVRTEQTCTGRARTTCEEQLSCAGKYPTLTVSKDDGDVSRKTIIVDKDKDKGKELTKDVMDVMDDKVSQDTKDHHVLRDNKDSQDTKDHNVLRDNKDSQDTKDFNVPRDNKDSHDTKVITKAAKQTKTATDTKGDTVHRKDSNGGKGDKGSSKTKKHQAVDSGKPGRSKVIDLLHNPYAWKLLKSLLLFLLGLKICSESWYMLIPIRGFAAIRCPCTCGICKHF